jgi:phosphoribosyl 1,2-cyclic phosphodiesterase
MCDRKYNIILNGKQSIDLPNNKIVRNKLNNIQTIISQDDNEEQKKLKNLLIIIKKLKMKIILFHLHHYLEKALRYQIL